MRRLRPRPHAAVAQQRCRVYHHGNTQVYGQAVKIVLRAAKPLLNCRLGHVAREHLAALALLLLRRQLCVFTPLHHHGCADDCVAVLTLGYAQVVDARMVKRPL